MNYVTVIFSVLKSLGGLAKEGEVVMIKFCWRKKDRQIFFVNKSGRWRWQQKGQTSFVLYLGTIKKDFKNETILFRSPQLVVTTKEERLTQLIEIDNSKQKELLFLARETGTKFLQNNFVEIESVSSNRISVCAALWTEGKVRGSMMRSANTLEEAVQLGVIGALQDRRWKPLSLSDWQKTQIEITIYSPLRLPIEVTTSQEIDYTKGYIANFNSQMGLYVPEVFNVVQFVNRQDFFNSLLTQKAGLNKQSARQASVVQFDVVDFIEAKPNDSNPLLLQASMPSPASRESLHHQAIAEVVLAAIGWLKNIQEEDGNVMPIVHPFKQSFAQVDWSRLNFLIFALAEWEKVTPSVDALPLIEKILHYSEFYQQQREVDLNDLYGVVYLAHAYVSLGYRDKALVLANRLQTYLLKQNFQSILFLETITLLHRLGKGSNTKELEKMCKEQFWLKKNNKTTDVASWAEAVVAFNYTDKTFAKEVADWMVSHQQADGSFTQSHTSHFVYTRGTAKIFEALAIDKESYRKELALAHNWLKSMQYDEKNTYFVSPSFRKYLYGGMRHDYNNPDAWIDSVGHYILGASRIL